MLAREVIQRVREIQIHTGRQVADVLAGQYVSVFKGRGIEFDEVRPYIPGDDVRTIDWNVTARMGQPYVKRYVEERQLTLMLMADISASQDFGSAGRSKREATAELCALLAFSAMRNDDKVGLTLFHGGIEQYIPARKGSEAFAAGRAEVLAHGSGAAPRSRTGEARLLREAGLLTPPGLVPPLPLAPVWPPPGMVADRTASDQRGRRDGIPDVGHDAARPCVSSSATSGRGFLPAMQIANRKHDVIAVLMTDPRELEIPNVGLVSLADAETGKLAAYDTGSSAFRRQLARLAQERVERLKHTFRASDIDFIHIDASSSIVDPLVRFFRMRERRMRR